MNNTALRLDRITRTFREGEGMLEVFRDVSLAIQPGELVALVGPSGAGKSSLLHIAGLLEAPSSGEVIIANQSAAALPDAERTRLRRDTIGFIYQAHHLLPEFDALENVVLPQLIAGKSRKTAQTEATRLLTELGLGTGWIIAHPDSSGGEQQRVSIARAVANRPKILLADEPTGNLDPRTSGGVFDALLSLVRNEGVAALIATHNHDLAARMDRTLVLDQGSLKPA